MAGLIPPSPRLGNRLEYLAHYILSGLGAAVPVLRTEDVGVDFYCALGKDEPVGITIADSFAVQLKSGADPHIELGGKTIGGTWRDYEINWFLNLEFPLLFGVPHHQEKRLDLYSTSLVRWITMKPELPFKVRIYPDPPGISAAHLHPDQVGHAAGIEAVPAGCDGMIYDYHVGPPIVSCTLDDLNDPARVLVLQQRLRDLLVTEHLNTVYRKLGLPYWTWVLEVETNISHNLAYAYDVNRAGVNRQSLLAELVPFICTLGYSYLAANDMEKLTEVKGIASQLPLDKIPEPVRQHLAVLFGQP